MNNHLFQDTESLFLVACSCAEIYGKADGVASDAILAKWHMVNYMNLVETYYYCEKFSKGICNLGFRHYVYSLYSFVSFEDLKFSKGVL